MSNHFLEELPRVRILKCRPRCAKWFALELQRTERHDVLAQIDYYRCRYCQSEVVYGKRLPPGAV